MANRILIIQPSHYVSKTKKTLQKSKWRPLVPLPLPYLPALTLSGLDIQHLDEKIDNVNFSSKPDLVAMTCWTMHAERGYDVAARFREQVIPVITGGPHAWFNPEETAEQCDAVGVGEGEHTADFEVLSGLDAGDLTALSGNFQLTNGMRIRTGRNRMMLHSLACFILLLASLCPSSAAQPASVVDSAHELFNEGRYAQARAVLAPEAAKGSNDAEIYYWMAKSDFEMRHFDGSIDEVERAITLNPNNAEYHRLLGEAYGRKADHSSWFAGVGLAKRTRAELEHASELDPRNVPVRRDLVNFYVRAPGFVGGGEQKALDEIQQVVALDPVEGHLARLDYYQERKQWDQADQECKSVLAAKPNRAGPYYEVASYYIHRDNGAALRLAVTEGRQNAGDAQRFDYYYGVAAVLTGNLDDAEAALKRYLAVPPHSDQPSPADAHVWLGRLYEKQGNHNAALAQFQEALKNDPNNKAARDAFKHEEK